MDYMTNEMKKNDEICDCCYGVGYPCLSYCRKTIADCGICNSSGITCPKCLRITEAKERFPRDVTEDLIVQWCHQSKYTERSECKKRKIKIQSLWKREWTYYVAWIPQEVLDEIFILLFIPSEIKT
jgi:hypothetical protein